MTSENKLVTFKPRPAPDTPDTASTTMPDGSTRPSCSSGASASAARGGIATGRGDVAGRADLGAVQLGQTEREPVEQVRCGMRLAVPLFVVGARKPEVGAEVDEVPDGVDQRSRDRLRLAVRQGEEDHIEAGEVAGLQRRVHERRVGRGERREQLRHGAPTFESAVTCTTSMSGWPASRRRSSAPVYPDPPTTAARYAMPNTIQVTAYLCQPGAAPCRRRRR